MTASRVGVSRRTGVVLLVLLSIAWGFGWPAIKFVVSEIPPVTYRAMNIPLAGLSMMVLSLLTGVRLRVPPGRWPPLLLAATLNIGILVICMTYAMLYIPAGFGAILAYTMPLWAVVFGIIILRERLTARSAIALGLGLAGVLILLGDRLGSVGDTPLGSAIMLSGALCWGLGTVVQKKVDWQMPAVALAAWQLLIGGLPFIPAAFLFESVDLSTVSTRTWIWFAYSTWGPLMFCYYAWFTVVKLFPVSVSAISILASPVIGVLSSVLLLGESLNWRLVVAAILVCSALAMVLIATGPARPPGADASGPTREP